MTELLKHPDSYRDSMTSPEVYPLLVINVTLKLFQSLPIKFIIGNKK